MHNICNYYLVSHHDINDFQTEIKYMLKNNWELHGETKIVAVADEYGSQPLFCQAMIKREKYE